MDANRSRFHALWGHAGDWETVPKGTAEVEFTDSGVLRLLSRTPAFADVAAIELKPEARRGAARDRFGNWYWVGPSEREILVQSSGTGAVGVFWPTPAPTPVRGGAFAPRGPAPLGGRFAGAAVTRHHALVVGTLDPGGLLAFDLTTGGPPRRVAAPAGVAFVPFDIAALGSGVVVLDRTNRTAWAFDRDLVPRPIAAPAQTLDMFQPRSATTPRRVRDANAPAAAVPLPAGWPAALAVEAVSCDAALVLHEAGTAPANPAVAGEGSLVAKIDWAAPQPVVSAPARGTRANSELKVPGQSLAGHDFALAPNRSEEAAPARRLEVALANGKQAVAFKLDTMEALPDFIPLRRFGGRGYVGAAPGDDAQRPGYDSGSTWATAAVMPRPRFAPAATLILPDVNGWDSKADACVWHRVFFDASIPPGCSLRFAAEVRGEGGEWQPAVGKTPYLEAGPAGSVAPWQPDPRRRAEGSELPFAPALPAGFATWESLLQGAHGRYLRLTLTLSGDGTRTPRIRAARVWYPRFSYLEHYLPAIYRDDATSADYLERFLANAEGTLTGIEDKIGAARALVDPRTAPAEALDWLTGWLGLAASPGWEERRKRLFLRHAPAILRNRGTIRGLQWALHLALDTCLDESVFTETRTDTSPYRIVEAFRRRRGADAIALGDPTVLDLPRQVKAGTARYWRPEDGPAVLSAKYAEEVEVPGVPFPLCPPPIPAETARWAAFARRELGFVPQARPGDPADEARWAAFLHRRYRIDDPPGAPLTATLDVLPSRAADWHLFETVVMAAARSAHRFEVLIPATSGVRATASPSPAALEESRRNRELAKQVVRREAPAHCRFEVRLYASAFRVGGSRVGADTLLGLGSRDPEFHDDLILGGAFVGEAVLRARPPRDEPGRTTVGQTATFRARDTHGATRR